MKYSLSPLVQLVRDGDGAVLLDQSRGLVYGLNPTADRILQDLQQGLDVAQIEANVRRAFSLDGDAHADPRTDIVALIDRLAGAGLVIRDADGERG